VIHLFFRRRPRPTPFPAIDFILRARRETERRLRLRKLLLFTARTLLIAAVAAALARPRLQRPEEAAAASPRGPSSVAIVLDASASMGYRLHGRALFDRAREDALGALDELGGEEPATAVVCGGPAPAAPPPTFDKVAVRKALRDAELSHGHSDMSACVAAAVRALSGEGSGAALGKRIVAATDLTAAAWRLDAPAPMLRTRDGAAVRPEVTIVDAARGEALPNVAVVDLAAEPDAAVGPRGYRITATLAATGGARSAAESKGEGHDLELQLHAGPPTSPVVLRAFSQVPASGVMKKVLAHRFAAGGPAALSVTLPGDDLAIDDARALTLSVPRDVRALVVNGSPSPVRYRDEAFFVEAALSAPASPARPTVVDAESLSNVRLADYDVVFLLNVRALGPKAKELVAFVEGGGGLFAAMGDQVDADLWNEELGAILPRPLHLVKTAAERGTAVRPARFADVDWAHPALQVFTGAAREGFEGTRTWRYMLLKPTEQKGAGGEHVLVSFDDGAPALVEARRGRGRVVLYTSTADREWSDWTIRTSFLPTVQRIAAWLSGGLEERRDVPSVVDAPRTVTVGEGQTLVAVVAPDGREIPAERLAREGGGPQRLAPDLPGLWAVKVQESGKTRVDPKLAFAVFPDPRESDTTRLDPQELTAYFGGASHAKLATDGPIGERQIPLWSILIALGLAAFVLEGVLIA
jgi:hypothetical protein